jgi:hypothetical protein
MTGSRRPSFVSDDWMLEQQMRAELEAEAWRRMRAELALASPALQPLPAPEPEAAPIDFHSAGSAVLKGLVRFGLAAFAAYLAWIAAVDGGLAGFEAWLAIGTTFVIALALSMLDPARRFVHVVAETMRWLIITAAGFGAAWLIMQMSA